MPQDPVSRGCGFRTPPLLPPRRLRSFLFILLALACGTALCAGLATAATGGAGLGVTHAPSRGAKHRVAGHRRAKRRATRAPAKHRSVKRRAARHRSAGRPGHTASSADNPLTGRAMWIWELPSTDGGNLSSIISSAHRFGVSTLFIKSSDGTDLWSQFNSSVVSALHANGLKVCAWQYVYGNHPVTEAYLGADAVRAGADCLIIDAESQYEGKYISAQTYMGRLRELVGSHYPVALAGFPYVDFHPAFPYSVFLGPNGAQYNAPQMYWKDIGVTVDSVFAHTYSYNLVYGRPIFPLGQVYSDPPAHQIVRFRQLSRVYGAAGVSWWDWQEAYPYAWTALSRPAGNLHAYVPYKVMADLGKGAQGDMVVWAQEHLISAGYPIGVSGGFGPRTLTQVEHFQAAHGLTADGVIGPETWQALLRYRPAHILWAAASHAPRQAIAGTAGLTPTQASGARVTPLPESASRPARRDEIPANIGAGTPTHP